MSYDISLNDRISGNVLQLDNPHQMKGGTYAIGGTTDCELNVTYNYSKHWTKAFGDDGSIRNIYGKTGAESIPILSEGISNLGDDVDEDYWKPTEGNVKRALIQLLTLAQMRPDGIWQGD